MSGLFDLKLVEHEPGPDADVPPPASAKPPEPRVFVRTIKTPPGAPWEQTRAARLEVRHGAPLPIEQTYWQLKRLDAWRSGEAATFAALYVRAADIAERLEAVVEVEGRQVKAAFEPPAVVAARARRSVVVALVAAGVTALLAVSSASAIMARSDAEQRLSALERDVAVRMSRAKGAQLTRNESAALVRAAPGAGVAAPLAELAWAMANRAEDARIEAWRWEQGTVVVEARGDAVPIVDPRRPPSAPSPVQAGVQSWRFKPAGSRP